MKRLFCAFLALAIVTIACVPAFADEELSPAKIIDKDIDDYYESDGSYRYDATQLFIIVDTGDDEDPDFGTILAGVEYSTITVCAKNTGEDGQNSFILLICLYDDPASVDLSDEEACKARLRKAVWELDAVDCVVYMMPFYSSGFNEFREKGVGDVDGSGAVNAKDVVALMKFIIGGRSLKMSAADIDCNGKVNAKDVTILMKKLVNGSNVTGGSSLCSSVHDLTASYATETVHNAYDSSPRCEKRTYLVITCRRDGCGYIEKIHVGSSRIASCHG